MKKIFIPLIVFILVIVSTVAQLSPNELSFKKVNLVKEKPIIHIVPLGDINKKYPELVKSYIQGFYGFKCVIDSQIPLTKDILAASKTRYEASKILEKYNSNKNVLLLTDVDIAYFNKIKNIKEYGIIGLGLRPGKTCVVSTFRIKNDGQKKLLDRLKKVSIHEVGHNLGLDHCNYDRECVMNDARGSAKQIDRERVWLCDNCRRIIGMK
jgi:archaemetzincin